MLKLVKKVLKHECGIIVIHIFTPTQELPLQEMANMSPNALVQALPLRTFKLLLTSSLNYSSTPLIHITSGLPLIPYPSVLSPFTPYKVILTFISSHATSKPS